MDVIISATAAETTAATFTSVAST